MRYFKTLILLLAITLCTGCAVRDPKYISLEKKDTPYEYSNIVYKNIRSNKSFYLEVFDGNMYKTFSVDDEDCDILLSFFESLTNNNYVSEYDFSNLTVQYKLIVNFKEGSHNEKYIFNIYNEDFVTLYPWDGNLPEDMIIMDNVPKYNNLYDYCVYIINKAHKL